MKYDNILVIGDTHIPFERREYLEFCKQTAKTYKCKKIIHVGDILDNHANNFHGVNPGGYSAKYELEEAKSHIKLWYKAFPVMDIILGNHDRLIQRQMFAAGIYDKWLKGFSDVLEVPNWNFNVNYEYANILFIHGEGGKVLPKVLNRRKSVVQGHFHTLATLEYNVSDSDRIFALQTPVGIDDKKYAFEYAKDFTKKSIIGCSVILDNGTLPIIIPMNI